MPIPRIQSNIANILLQKNIAEQWEAKAVALAIELGGELLHDSVVFKSKKAADEYERRLKEIKLEGEANDTNQSARNPEDHAGRS